MKFKRLIATLSCIIGMPCYAQASGFMQQELAASATGVANAFVATADDAAAAVINPAGQAWQDGLQLSVGYLVDYRDSSVSLPAGIAPNSGSEPNLFAFTAGWMPHDGRLGATLAYAPAYHLQNDWGRFFGARAGSTSLFIDRLSIDAVYRVSTTMAVSLGGDAYFTNMSLHEAGAVFHDRDFSTFGGHASLLWKFAPQWSFGLMARSGAKVKLKSGVSSMGLRLPEQVQFGLSYLLADAWRVEADAVWSRWSALRDMSVVSGGVVRMAHPLNLRDTFGAMLGLTWTLRENTQIRIGYAFDPGASRSLGFDPIVADQDGHRLAIGVGGDAFGMHLDLAYDYTFYADRNVAAGVYAGTYRDRRQTIALTASRAF